MFLKRRKLIKRVAIPVVLINLIFLMIFLLSGYPITYLLIINLLCFFFGWLIYLVNRKIVYLYNEMLMVYPTKKNYRKCDLRNYDVVNLGGSEAKKLFNYQGAQVKGLNWAQPLQSLKYDLLILKNFHSVIKKEGVVILPISIENLLLVKNSSSQKTFYAKFLDPLLLTNDNFSRVGKKQKINNKYPLFYDFSNSMRLLLKVAKINLKKKECVISYPEGFKHNSLETVNWESEAKKKIEIIKEIMNFCETRNLRFVLVVLKYDEKKLKQKDHEKFCSTLKLIKAEINEEKVKMISRLSHEVLNVEGLTDYDERTAVFTKQLFDEVTQK